MKLELNCPHAKYESGTMRILCSRAKGYCAHQYFKRCKGWWALTDTACRCPARDDKKGA